VDAVAPSADVAGHVAQESPSPDDDDLEVPSFLRRRAKRE
jgi:hypothetical protein